MISVRIYYCLFIVCQYFSAIKTLPMKEDFRIIMKRQNNSTKMLSTKKFHIQSFPVSNLNEKHLDGTSNRNISHIRVKRQTGGGAGKFAEASKMPQIKLIRLLLQMIKNSWDTSHVGGIHPLHPLVPKIFMSLYKQKVVEFFIPDVGEDIKTKAGVV